MSSTATPRTECSNSWNRRVGSSTPRRGAPRVFSAVSLPQAHFPGYRRFHPRLRREDRAVGRDSSVGQSAGMVVTIGASSGDDLLGSKSPPSSRCLAISVLPEEQSGSSGQGDTADTGIGGGWLSSSSPEVSAFGIGAAMGTAENRLGSPEQNVSPGSDSLLREQQ